MRNQKGQFIKNGVNKLCKVCLKSFYLPMCSKDQKYCSRACYFLIKKIPKEFSFKGKKHSIETKLKMKLAQVKEKHWNWKGGSVCKCGKSLDFKSKECRNCLDQSGINNPNYRHGLSKKRSYLVVYESRRRARLRNSLGNHSPLDWIRLKIKYKYMCLCCKKQEPEIKLTQDHIIPLIKGGTDYIENIQPLCQSCNSRKSVNIVNYMKIYA